MQHPINEVPKIKVSMWIFPKTKWLNPIAVPTEIKMDKSENASGTKERKIKISITTTIKRLKVEMMEISLEADMELL